MKKNSIISIILIVLGILMLTVFSEPLSQIDTEVFDFLAPLIVGIGLGMVIKSIFPVEKKTDK